MSEFPYDSALIATVISVAVSLSVLFYREKKLEPEKWKKNAQLQVIEKRLQTYGELLNLLETTAEKARRQRISERHPNLTHLLEIPHDSEIFRDIFQKHRYLLSHDLIQEYLRTERQDDFFALSRPTTDRSHNVIHNLADMQNRVENEYKELRKKYQKMTGYTFE